MSPSRHDEQAGSTSRSRGLWGPQRGSRPALVRSGVRCVHEGVLARHTVSCPLALLPPGPPLPGTVLYFRARAHPRRSESTATNYELVI